MEAIPRVSGKVVLELQVILGTYEGLLVGLLYDLLAEKGVRYTVLCCNIFLVSITVQKICLGKCLEWRLEGNKKNCNPYLMTHLRIFSLQVFNYFLYCQQVGIMLKVYCVCLFPSF